ncbi:MAG TPA: CBS domain-containing protein [Streptosporangiaceae bacterium]|nr:CBS domain-containing protein [Streptosporangiaceae bacterium]
MRARVKDVMTTRVIAARADASCADLAAMLREHRVSGFPVVDGDGVVVGVISESDLLARQEAPGPRRKRPSTAELTAADLMSWPPATIGPDETVRHAARLMYARKLRRLPVIDQRGRLVGLVTRADLLSAFTRPDDEIRREVTQDVIADGFFTDPDRFTVTVKDGVVTLAGSPGSVILGRNIADQARHVEGVVAVRDRFTYPAPKSHSASPVASDPGL